MILASEDSSDKKYAIEEANELVNEYSKTRQKIKKQLVQCSIEEKEKAKKWKTARVDLKLIEKLYTIVREVKKLWSPFPLEFKTILNILKQIKIRRKNKHCKNIKSSLKNSPMKNVSFSSEKESLSLLFLKK